MPSYINPYSVQAISRRRHAARLTALLCAAVLMLLPASCVDDWLLNEGITAEGETFITLEASFSPFAEGDLTRAEISGGNGRLLTEIQSLYLFLYDEEGNLVELSDAGEKEKYFPNEFTITSSMMSDSDRYDSDASNGHSAESKTKTISGIDLRLPFGRYYIVAAANLKRATVEALKSGDAYKTLDGLRRMKIRWNTDNIGENSEMLGYFTDAEIHKPSTSAPSAIKAFGSVAVNRGGMKLHAWLRRAASKVTIDFDGSGLRENVTVYIKEARICDIPYDCTLGFGQPQVSESEGTRAYNHKATNSGEAADGLIPGDAQTISYIKGESTDHMTTKPADTGGADDYKTWPRITKGTPKLKKNATDDAYASADTIDFHSENADALYFYENMQPNDIEPKKTKISHADLTGVGGVADRTKEKDGIPYGTYIEVTAYIHSNASGNSTHGEIKYRFMLGKNVTDNFEAERNYHYKLTLRPRGNGNDADWHIEYDEPKGFHVPNPWYVSYLYNHDAMLPFKYVPEDGLELTDLSAEIITNPWYPTDFKFEELTDTDKEILPTRPIGDDLSAYQYEGNRGNWNGFLSLRVTNNTVLTLKDACGVDKWGGYGEGTQDVNKPYYNGETTSKIKRGSRVYLEGGEKKIYTDYPAGTSQELKDRDDFSYTKSGDTYSFNIPLFTRAKTLVKQTGYSGNNPYVDFQRIARVRITAKLVNKENRSDTTTDETLINCVQVRRVVNPKGVYRKSRNHEPFNVNLMWLTNDGDGTFENVISHGPWKAEIIGDANFITLDGRRTVSGSTETPVNFTIRFNRMNNDDQVRNAVVRIKYHNYTCTHLIFVRQGYAPQAIVPKYDCMDYDSNRSGDGTFKGGSTPAVWDTFNMITSTLKATDPRDEGSLFKFQNSFDPIDAFNNIHIDNAGNPLYHNLSEKEFKNNANTLYRINEAGNLSGGIMTWTDITDQSGFFNEMTRTATMRHFEQLYCSNNIHFGYGVLYADGATKTQDKIEMAYGYYRRDKYKNGSPKGMRGLFVYYWDGLVQNGSSYNAKNIFFPIGRAGYGHRKNGLEPSEENKGILRYASNRGVPYPTFKTSGPIFVSIYRRPGAIYWAGKTEPDKKWLQWDRKFYDETPGVAYGLDINYFSFDVNAITGYNISNGADACFVRCVAK